MNKQAREELKRMAEAATPGPWRTAAWTTGIRGTEVMDKHHVRISCDMLEHNSEFVATANPAAIQSLLAYVDRLEAQRDRLLGACKAGLEIATEAVKTFGPCDHDVGICVCGENRVALDMAEAITEAESQS